MVVLRHGARVHIPDLEVYHYYMKNCELIPYFQYGYRKHAILDYTQWRNVTICCPPADFFAPHTKTLVSQKKKKKFNTIFCPPHIFCVDQSLS